MTLARAFRGFRFPPDVILWAVLLVQAHVSQSVPDYGSRDRN
jgi:hypothetical protein